MSYVLVGVAVFSAFTAYQSGQAQAQSSRNQQRIAEANAEQSRLNELDAMNRGANAAGEKRIEARQLLARQRALASGISPDTGTMADIQGETTTYGELDALKIVNNAQREARGFEVEQSNYLMSAQAAGMSAQNAQTGSYLGAGASLLSGASQAAAYNARVSNPSGTNPFGRTKYSWE